MEDVLVSVCMITYNHELFIREAIEGVLNQKTKFKIELIIGEDCSRDNTRSIIKEYEDKYPQIISAQYPTVNRGMTTNFSIVMNSARGKYLAICEGDDYWTDEYKLQKQVDFMEANVEYSGCAHQSIVVKKDIEDSLFKTNVPNEINIENLIGGRLFHTASILFKREVLSIYNAAPPVFSCDRFLFICISLKGKIFFSDEAMCIYRKHGKGTSSTAEISQLKLDLNSISYLSELNPNFPRHQYKSYVLATIGMRKNGSFFTRLYYLSLSLIYSFSFFPNNILVVIKFLSKRLK